MSDQREIQINCPKCKKASPFVIWRSINTGEDPSLKQAVKDRSAFRFICPDCGMKTYLDYGFFYQQTEGRIMICYVVTEEDERTVQQMLKGNDPSGTMAKMIEEGYIIRVAHSRNELLEKMEIFDAGLDDRIIELCKLHVLAFYQGENPEAANVELRYYRDKEGDRNCVLIISGGEKKGMTEIPQQLYDDLKEKYSWKLPELSKERPVIDRQWAMKLMGVRTEE